MTGHSQQFKDHDFIFKCNLIGCRSVGKSTLLSAWSNWSTPLGVQGEEEEAESGAPSPTTQPAKTSTPCMPQEVTDEITNFSYSSTDDDRSATVPPSSCYYVDVKMPDPAVTIGIDFQMRRLKAKGRTVKMQVWDSLYDSGRYISLGMITSLFRGSSVLIFVYDISERSTFDAIKNEYYKEVEKTISSYHSGLNFESQITKILVGAKSDLRSLNDPKENFYQTTTTRTAAPHLGVVQSTEGQALAEELGMDAFFETSIIRRSSATTDERNPPPPPPSNSSDDCFQMSDNVPDIFKTAAEVALLKTHGIASSSRGGVRLPPDDGLVHERIDLNKTTSASGKNDNNNTSGRNSSNGYGYCLLS